MPIRRDETADIAGSDTKILWHTDIDTHISNHGFKILVYLNLFEHVSRKYTDQLATSICSMS